jgi:hypothetical protein
VIFLQMLHNKLFILVLSRLNSSFYLIFNTVKYKVDDDDD